MATTVDWMKQAEEMVKTWTGSQQTMWEKWLNTMQGVSSYSNREAWERTMDTWHDSVRAALDAQVTWTQFWTERVAAAGSSQQVNEWSKQSLEMTKQWTDSQKQLWDNWFSAVKSADPAELAKNWKPEEMQKAMQTWQDSARKSMEAQMEMVRMWTGSQAKTSAGTKAK